MTGIVRSSPFAKLTRCCVPLARSSSSLPPRSPGLNAHAERWVRTAREECLDHIIILNERHLRWALGEFIRYYDQRRPHRSMQRRPPNGPVDCCKPGKVVRRQILDGLINDYHREAA